MKDFVVLAAYEDTAGYIAPSGFDKTMAIAGAMTYNEDRKPQRADRRA